MSLTRSNIAYNLKISPHRHTLVYGANLSITYVFSSELYKNKFLTKLNQNRLSISESLTNRFGFTVFPHILSDLKLYTTIEKRGFLLYKDDKEVECPESLVLDGLNMTIKNYAE